MTQTEREAILANIETAHKNVETTYAAYLAASAERDRQIRAARDRRVPRTAIAERLNISVGRVAQLAGRPGVDRRQP